MINESLTKNKPNTKEEIQHYLFTQFPSLKIKQEFYGHVLSIEDDVVCARIQSEKGEEYDCEFEKHIFPKKDLSEGISFYLIIGSVKEQLFSHVNYFYWTQQQIDEIKLRANELCNSLINLKA